MDSIAAPLLPTMHGAVVSHQAEMTNDPQMVTEEGTIGHRERDALSALHFPFPATASPRGPAKRSTKSWQ